MGQYWGDVYQRDYDYWDHCGKDMSRTLDDSHPALFETALEVVLSLLSGLAEIVTSHPPTRSKLTLLSNLHSLQDQTEELQMQRDMDAADLHCRTALLANDIANVLIEWPVLATDERTHVLVTEHSLELAACKGRIMAETPWCSCSSMRAGCLALDGLLWCIGYVSVQVSHVLREWRHKYRLPLPGGGEGSSYEECEREVKVSISGVVMVKTFDVGQEMAL